ncbi:ABC transporter permease [Metabacillus iocasae]|uniref:ABC-2 type transport system permease protein n=1 Tax=Priestia iocasae TaxID=2291674 RepID=A0ABS2QU42_9BACI|nr:ABC transporter permease [Metabacillus iocasae]MBM7702996.1 ABC-2 type transport system permease protein [Metabacillus iocasae]
MDLQSLWAKRLADFFEQMSKYFSIIASSIFYILIIGGSIFIYYYMTLLKQLPTSFPREAVAALFVSIMTIRMRIRTFFKKPDIVFLLAAESHLSSYIKRSLTYSTTLNSFTLFIALVMVIPLVSTFHIVSWTLVSTAALLLTTWFIWVKQWLPTRSSLLIHTFIHIVSMWAMFYFLFSEKWLLSLLVWMVNGGFLYILFSHKKRGFNWLYLIDQEEKNTERLYRFIHLFVDVPHLKNTFHKRTLFIVLAEKAISFKQPSTYTYLFLRLAIRYDQYFGMYIRLTLIGLMILYFVPAKPWLVTVSMLYMTGYQLLPLQRARNEMVRLYPLTHALLQSSFLKVILSLLIVQASILTLFTLFTHPLSAMLMVFLAQAIFIGWFVYHFAKKRWKVSR